MRIFGSVESQTESVFPFLYNTIFQKWQFSELPSFPPEMDIYAHGLFCIVLNAQQLLFEAFSHIMHIFGSVELQRFQYIITFETND